MQGFDTVRSTDHAWGPRLQVFLGGDDFRAHAEELRALLDRALPETFRGHPVRFSFPYGAPARHWVDVHDLRGFFMATIEDPGVRSLPPVGAIDQFVDSTDVTSSADRRRRCVTGPVPAMPNLDT
ncbi:hypothetical protein [Streptomyces sp. NPDC059452]|uniref:hypothetical protein n=1 Tax=Streptomyces sp. NPDC059452 TaxID=3346835 RepID=UPI00369132EB